MSDEEPDYIPNENEEFGENASGQENYEDSDEEPKELTGKTNDYNTSDEEDEEDEESIMGDETETNVDEDVYNTFEDNKDFIELYHPEEIHLSFDEIHQYSLVERNEKNQIIDPHHKSYPLLSKYEKTKIIGMRVTQLNHGAKPFIDIKDIYLDKSLIAERELKEKKIPYIIKRPIPDGTFEYWNIKDLEII
jgi:DNA-directed RNA polymerase I, II, and III subunit RPABC2|tara:strand:+ start:3026 stop:3601 length:576 start_codon:yes stop_codon:yes gene_type:complete